MERGSSPRYLDSAGFTAIELMVTVGIFAIISAVVFARFPEFNQNISLRRTVQEVALAIRESQVFALGVRRFGSGEGTLFPGYGTHFELVRPTSFTAFADIDGNKRQTDTAEVIETFRIQGGDRVTGLCGNKRSSPPGECGLPSLDIHFLRPSPAATLSGSVQEYADIAIIITSPGGTEREIVVWKTGQIGIEHVE